MSKTILLESSKELIDTNELEELDNDLVTFTSSYYLRNKEEIDALERYIMGSRNPGNLLIKTSSIEIAPQEDIPA